MPPEGTTRNGRPPCLVIEPDDTKRAFLGEAWAHFAPGFDVITVSSLHAGLEWLPTLRPDIVSVGAAVDQESIVSIVDAVDALHDGRAWCLVVERPPGSSIPLVDRPTVRIVDLWNAVSLEQVLRAGRAAANLVQSSPMVAKSAPMMAKSADDGRQMGTHEPVAAGETRR